MPEESTRRVTFTDTEVRVMRSIINRLTPTEIVSIDGTHLGGAKAIESIEVKLMPKVKKP